MCWSHADHALDPCKQPSGFSLHCLTQSKVVMMHMWLHVSGRMLQPAITLKVQVSSLANEELHTLFSVSQKDKQKRGNHSGEHIQQLLQSA